MMKNLAPTNLANISHQKKILNMVLKKREDFLKIFFSDNCLILQLSIATQLSINLLFASIQFSFFDEQVNMMYLPK